ncbi:50S ribosomal protein L27 [Candidatus Nardonella dryophthoridicola]|uniref:50S ribosomal protein L27 n=1 Tax=Candidatus Nardonella dryophthoridicola TaxID=1971485 RepID=UPI001AD873DB|nr:50S ribosomal protein L27 [Candidatus Nardonella dryophthoridicola]QTJ62948.1 50S ribosomal protein L27 [Candidatus Nardonella dryophthoridicola]
MAQKKATGSTKNGRDSIGKRLGFKHFGSELVYPGNIILRQRGSKFHPGYNSKMGKDYTIFSKIIGKVFFRYKKFKNKKIIDIIPLK